MINLFYPQEVESCITSNTMSMESRSKTNFSPEFSKVEKKRLKNVDKEGEHTCPQS